MIYQEIIFEFPPVYPRLVDKFHIGGNRGVIFSWGDKIFNPYRVEIPDHLIYHEAVHGTRQTSLGIEKWWEKYIKDEDFRLIEEALAHAAEYKALVGPNSSRPVRRRTLVQVAKRLSGPLYGHMTTPKEAKKLILLGVGSTK